MKYISNLALVCCVAVGLSACSRPAKPYIEKGNVLSYAGFVAHPANTTARYGLMNLLPPGMLTYRMAPDGHPIYLYADPIACGCVYMGSEAAYQLLKQHMAILGQHGKHKALTTDPSLVAMDAENNRDSAPWDWTVWSPAADPDNNQPRHMIGNYW